MEVIVLGLWALGLVALAWVVVLSRMLTRGRGSTDRMLMDWRWLRLLQQSQAEDTGWMAREWGDTLPMR